MADRIQLRRDTRANWESYNPILLEGEPGHVLDDPNLYKMGDGVHAWNDLPYRGYNGTVTTEVQNDENSVPSNAAVYKKESLDNTALEALIHPIEAEFKHSGFWYLNNGNLVKVANAECFYTDPIAFTEGMTLDMIAAIPSGIGLVYMVFDASGNLIDSQVTRNSSGSTVQYNYTAPANSAYIVCSSYLSSELIHCTIKRADNIKDNKFDNANIINSLTDTPNYDNQHALSYFWSYQLSNLFGYITRKYFINIYGKSVTYDFPDIRSYCHSTWIPINVLTKGKQLKNLVSNIRTGVIGLAFYTNVGEDTFIGYYAPAEDDGTLQDDMQFDIFVADAIASNQTFASAKYFRFTTSYIDFDNPCRKPVLELATSVLGKFKEETYLKGNGTTYTYTGLSYQTSEFIEMNDAARNVVIYGLVSYGRADVHPIAFYDADKNLIGNAYTHPDDNESTTMQILCTIDVRELANNYAYASYYRVCYDTAYGIRVVSKAANGLIQQANDFDKRWILTQFNKVICIGDSVTKGFVTDYPTYSDSNWAVDGYPAKLAKLMNTEVTNAGMSGDTAAEWKYGRTREFIHPSQYALYDFSEYDLAIIELGYNSGDGGQLDWNDLSDSSLDTETNGEWNGGMNNSWAYDHLVSGILSQNPKIKIVLMIMSNREFVNNHTVSRYITNLASKYNCQLIDLREDLDIHLDTLKWHGQYMGEDSQLHYDMVHFTAKGYCAKAGLIYNKLISLYKE